MPDGDLGCGVRWPGLFYHNVVTRSMSWTILYRQSDSIMPSSHHLKLYKLETSLDLPVRPS